MRKKRIPVDSKTKTLLQKEVGSKCLFCGNEDVDHFEIHHIDENPSNNDFSNLLFLCPLCHSKITKGDITKTEVMRLKSWLTANRREISQPAGKVINFRSKVDNAVVGDNNKITFNVRKQAKNKYPEGSIGVDNLKANYIGYLVGRYHEYKEYEVGKENMRYGIFLSGIKKRFKIGKTRTVYNIPETRFEELVEYIQGRIDETKLARINRSKMQFKNYETFDEYLSLHT